jgi:hypothetical protein
MAAQVAKLKVVALMDRAQVAAQDFLARQRRYLLPLLLAQLERAILVQAVLEDGLMLLVVAVAVVAASLPSSSSLRQ